MLNYFELHINDKVKINDGASEYIKDLNREFDRNIDSKYFTVHSIVDDNSFEIDWTGESDILLIHNIMAEKLIERVSIVLTYDSYGKPHEFCFVEFPSNQYKNQYVMEERKATLNEYDRYTTETNAEKRKKYKELCGSARLNFAMSKGFVRVGRKNLLRLPIQKET